MKDQHSPALPGFLLAVVGVVAALAGPARGDVRLPSIFSDHMVLQRAAAVPVWGWADPGEEVTVTIAGHNYHATADKDGKWQVKLDKLDQAKESGPLTLAVAGKNKITVEDVLIGEVWLASGQSNMGLTVSGAKDFARERAAANFPRLRMFTVRHNPAREPQADCPGSWQVCSPETVGGFSATAYFFGRDLHRDLKVPVGMIHSSVGGTPIEAWTSQGAQERRPELKGLLEAWQKREADYNPETAREAYAKELTAWKEAARKAKEEGKAAPRQPRKPENPRDSHDRPGALFNGMIAPLIPYAIKGAIWYQGESNAGSAESGAGYAVQLPLLVEDWRSRWDEGDFPFGWVQLPNFQGPFPGWPLVREAELKALSLAHTGMAVTIDVGEAHNIHPRDKQDVGYRMALWARARVYGEKIPWSGPLPAGHSVHGNVLEVTFKHADQGLVARDGDLRGFVIAGADRKWRPGTARIEGDRVLVSSADVPAPVAARYDWASDPDGNLYNGAGLPASPFRTDDWPVTPPEGHARAR